MHGGITNVGKQIITIKYILIKSSQINEFLKVTSLVSYRSISKWSVTSSGEVAGEVGSSLLRNNW